MRRIYTIKEVKTQNRFLSERNVICSWLLKAIAVFVFILFVYEGQAQIKMPDMVVPNDSWGMIDVNKLFGGAMQVNTHDELLAIDVQYLKKGMLFIVYDDDQVTAGVQTKIYMFLPAEGVWDYATPFLIPAADQNKTIETASLESSLVEVNMGTSLAPGESPDLANKTVVYYDTTDSKFYRYDTGTSDWVEIQTTATELDPVVAIIDGLVKSDGTTISAAVGGVDYLRPSDTPDNATNATNTTITDDVATATSVYPTWVTANAGDLPHYVSSTKLSFMPSTGIATAGGFVGISMETTTLKTNGALYSKPVRKVNSSPLVWSNDDVCIILLPGYTGDILLPSAAANLGRIVGINNRSGDVRRLAFTDSSDTGIYSDEGWAQFGVLTGMVWVISDGTSWRLYSGRP